MGSFQQQQACVTDTNGCAKAWHILKQEAYRHSRLTGSKRNYQACRANNIRATSVGDGMLQQRR